MSPSNINSFVGDLVQMAQAMERLPQVEQELANTASDLSRAQDTIAARETSILSLKAQIDELNAKLQKAEGDRDDAELRFLEADERASKALRLVKTAVDNLQQSQELIEPPKPVVSEPTPITQPPVQEVVHSIEPVTGVNQSSPSVSMDVTPPSVAPTTEATPASAPTAPTEWYNAQSDSVEAADPGPAVGPYYGKRYMEVPGFIPRQDWIDGGGTNEDYDWRP